VVRCIRWAIFVSFFIAGVHIQIWVSACFLLLRLSAVPSFRGLDFAHSLFPLPVSFLLPQFGARARVPLGRVAPRTPFYLLSRISSPVNLRSPVSSAREESSASQFLFSGLCSPFSSRLVSHTGFGSLSARRSSRF
jgi:hypothetical protein